MRATGLDPIGRRLRLRDSGSGSGHEYSDRKSAPRWRLCTATTALG
ncbi:hypothetical protein ACFWPQ_33805 [Streptomyces sp. NPDC058464]